MKQQNRQEIFHAVFPKEPLFRWRQILRAFFDPSVSEWGEITSLPKEMREKLFIVLPWMSLRRVVVLESGKHDTKKAVLECADGARIETVLMRNARGHWSVCVSSQVGCAMGCTFCATGSMGFTRNLSVDEIVDQFRFWQYELLSQKNNDENSKKEQPELNTEGDEVYDSSYISNVVFMGMGEPLANYESVREAIRILLEYTSLGSTRITVSTVGLLPTLRMLLHDPLWPPVRLAVSLHSADTETRKRIMPSSYDSFLDDLAEWARDYFLLHDERRQHLTFEYILLHGENDAKRDIEKLILFTREVGKVKINLIPYNKTASGYAESEQRDVLLFLSRLKQAGLTATTRRAMGDDISAACGQLVAIKKDE